MDYGEADESYLEEKVINKTDMMYRKHCYDN